MKNDSIKTIALILAGGNGSRLWPLSREKMPKQFLSLTGQRTMLQETCRRLFPFIPPENQLIITGQEHYHHVIQQVETLRNEISDPKASKAFIEVMAEPFAKNTAPAIFWAARLCQQRYGDDIVLLVLPSDHLITAEKEFQYTMQRGIAKAEEGALVTFGIRPTHAETGYGYIKIKKSCDLSQSQPVAAFVEKPDQARAEEYFKSGQFLWNSGMFAFHLRVLLEEGRLWCPEVLEPFLLCDPLDRSAVKIAYSQTESKSIDYAVMEKTDKAFVIPSSFGWSDVGNWQSFFALNPKDKHGNVVFGQQVVIDCKDCLIYGEEQQTAVVGMEATAIINTSDGLLICPLNQSQRVKEVVKELKKRGSPSI
ncbi:MAG: mannose-1-phosphate guanylyltransferase [Syntrophomonas sp.]|nr:mannose-1-phosphate guanylyltransferase [Syntrophomonas sp.]